jgi:sarcosine oxidase subunit alpha
MSGFRLATGGRIDRSRRIRFECNGRTSEGFAGDTLASALLANGVRIVGRSMKFHRPRGVLSAGVEEPNALFRVTRNGSAVPLVRATLQPLVDGLSARSENCFPSVTFDLGRMLDATHALWPAGFYNKTFMWPGWHTFERYIRRAAGLGRLPTGTDTTRYFHHNLHCDVLVCGGGRSGLEAAHAAGSAGARVVLIEQDSVLGGRLLAERPTVDRSDAWLTTMTAALAGMPNVRVMTRTTVAGYYDHNVLTAHDVSDAYRERNPAERFWKVRAKEVVLATGAIEQPLVFCSNDRPGVMLAGAVRHYLNRYAVAVGRSVVVATNNDDAYKTAVDLHDAGIGVVAVVDARSAPSSEAARDLGARGIRHIPSSMILEAAGSPCVRRVRIARLSKNAAGTEGAPTWLECDTLAVSGGWSPTVHLFSQAGGKLRYSEALACFIPDGCIQNVRVVGRANGELGPKPAPASAASRRSPAGRTDRQWIDFQHDVTVSDLELAVRENFTSVEHVKRYTTAGMSLDQGKTSNLNALSLLAELTHKPIADVGTTTYRPQFMPVTLGAIGGGQRGDLYAPTRLMPAHTCHQRHNATIADYGAWKRPRCYRSSEETEALAIEREVRAVRQHAGLFDSSPLGKIEVKGPDAAEFLNRLYVSDALTLLPGKVRYSLMLNENGIIIDDGVFAHLAPDLYVVSTSSSNAERIAAWLDEWHQCEWPDLRVVLAPVSSQWAVLTVSGPNARAIARSLNSTFDFSAEAFPHMSVRTGTLEGHPARIQRVSFTGELSYEISVPANAAEALWARLMSEGASLGITPIGIEAWLMLRLEKGFIHVGADTDGTTNAIDVGFGAVVDRRSTDFAGRRSLQRPNDRRTNRRQLVGIEPLKAGDRLVAGAHVVTGAAHKRRSEGVVTSAGRSPTLGRYIGLALLESGFSRTDECVMVLDAGRSVPARIVSPKFYDPTGKRMHG